MLNKPNVQLGIRLHECVAKTRPSRNRLHLRLGRRQIDKDLARGWQRRGHREACESAAWRLYEEALTRLRLGGHHDIELTALWWAVAELCGLGALGPGGHKELGTGHEPRREGQSKAPAVGINGDDGREGRGSR